MKTAPLNKSKLKELQMEEQNKKGYSIIILQYT